MNKFGERRVYLFFFIVMVLGLIFMSIGSDGSRERKKLKQELDTLRLEVRTLQKSLENHNTGGASND
jgi:uncharacterized membrane-anchored protein YhcB (DUF1043 family)